jgi:hypothetical protein
MIARQSASSGAGVNSPFAARDVGLEAEYPNLTEYLVLRTFADGSERETSTLLIFAVDGLWKVCLNDRAEGQCLWASGASHGDAMAALELMLESGSADWRRTRQVKSAKKS